ncbi:MAG: hypothetical protein LPL00_07230 [Alphaproteobacteria bacterium]|nr:hypothetical protein [Alphaproteobacteria bacterium]MDX5369357.1 hypothetical protein [Alphaproteobacteria bacterium]MDX5464038.1 hypothetical protein [Alphaproteobacteria bacterium]
MSERSVSTETSPAGDVVLGGFAREKHPFSRYTLDHPGLECLARAWRAARAGERIPTLGDVTDSLDVCTRSGVNMHLVEIDRDFVVHDVHGRLPTSAGRVRPWGDGGAQLRIKQDLIAVAFTGAPLCQTVRIEMDGAVRSYDQIALPLSADGASVTAVLIASDGRVH